MGKPKREIATLVCEDWADFRRTLEEKVFRKKRFVNGEFLYRGQSSAEYQLKTSFDRWFRGPRASRTAVSEKLLRAFAGECVAQTDMQQDVVTKEERLLALAQHHGLPTRLLDWSLSPYVAAFFAFSYTF